MPTTIFSRMRRNHGLEHATLNLLAKKRPHQSMAGYSTPWDIWILGNVPTQELAETAREALDRLRQGEAHLAVHANCGTNLVTSGAVAGMAGLVGMMGVGPRKRDKLERLPLVAALATLGLILSQPLGLRVQKAFTVSGDPQGLEIVSITQQKRGRAIAHRIQTQG